MAESFFPYQQWTEDALRSILKRSLRQVYDEGLNGDHHFYINFSTRHEDVDMPPFLRAQYPDEITIVLQHQFEDLAVEDEGFHVALYFSGRRQQLYVPYDAVVSFADPSQNFGIQVQAVAAGLAGVDPATADPGADEESDLRGVRHQDDDEDPDKEGGTVESFADAALADDEAEDGAEDEADAEDAGDGAEASANEPGSAEVITLDKFRNKS